MHKKANPKTIGAFVLGAIVLVMGGIVFFASGTLFQEKTIAVAFFDGSVKGLNVGAPINFRGARIGTVTGVGVVIEKDLDIKIPVTLQIEPDRAQDRRDDVPSSDALRLLIDRGLRAQLETQSFVTGQLNVALDFHPDTPVELHSEDPEILEIPTVRGGLQEVTRAAGRVADQLPQLVGNADELITELTDQLKSGPIARSLENIEAFTGALASEREATGSLISDAAGAMANIRRFTERLDGLADSGEETLGEAQATMREIRDVITDNRRKVDQALGSIADASETVDEILKENRQAINDFANVTLFEFSGLVTDTQQLVNTLNRVGEDLERDPARFFFGDQQQGFQATQ